MVRYFVVTLALGLALGAARPVAAQQVRAGSTSCDVVGGVGLVIGSHKATVMLIHRTEREGVRTTVVRSPSMGLISG
jgi:hypothetical protein